MFSVQFVSGQTSVLDCVAYLIYCILF